MQSPGIGFTNLEYGSVRYGCPTRRNFQAELEGRLQVRLVEQGERRPGPVRNK